MASCKDLFRCLQQTLTNTQQHAEAFGAVAGEKVLMGIVL